MDNIAGTKSSLTWAVHISVVLLVALWLFPTVGLLVSSFRTSDQIATSGWWKASFPSVQNSIIRADSPDTQFMEGDLYIIEGDLFEADRGATVSVYGISSRAIDAFAAGEIGELTKGGNIVVSADGHYRMTNTEPFTGSRGQRIFVTAETKPEFTLANYKNVLFDPSNREG